MFQRKSKKQIAKRLGSYLRSLRHEKGWTQSLAGKAVGVDSVTILRWELGLHSPSANRIAQVADAYGVDVSALIDAAEPEDQAGPATVIPIKGYLDAGTTPDSDSNGLGSISFSSPMIQQSPDDYLLVVSGNSLAPYGIHNGDVLLVCPNQPPKIGGLCVMEMEGCLFAGTYTNKGSLRVRNTTGTTVDLDLMPEQLIGPVPWHIRKI